MNKKEMEKYIPKHTVYCLNCPWRKHIDTIKLNKTNCDSADTCKEECWSSFETSCRIRVYRCEYLDYTDYKEDSLLWDGVKECDVSYE